MHVQCSKFVGCFNIEEWCSELQEFSGVRSVCAQVAAATATDAVRHAVKQVLKEAKAATDKATKEAEAASQAAVAEAVAVPAPQRASSRVNCVQHLSRGKPLRSQSSRVSSLEGFSRSSFEVSINVTL